MPGSILAVSDGALLTNPPYTAANTGTKDTSQLRPHTSGCSADARSPSPLFARWVRWQRKEVDSLDKDELRISTDERSISSSSEPSKPLPQPQSEHNDNDQHGHGNHTYTHTYNFSTSASSSNNQPQSPFPPPLTREQFNALPVAIQRKVCPGLVLSHSCRTCRFPFRHWPGVLWTRSCSLHSAEGSPAFLRPMNKSLPSKPHSPSFSSPLFSSIDKPIVQGSYTE